MSYGKLGVIKTIGGTPIFCLLDTKDQPTTVIPNFEDWMFKKVGHTVDLSISDKCFQLTDTEVGE